MTKNFLKQFKHLINLTLLILCIFFSQQTLADYTFPGGLPSGCTGSAGVYTCGNLNINQNVIFNDTGSIKITVNGNFDVGTYTVGSSAKAANVLFIVNGVTNINASTIHGSIYSGTNNISIGSPPTVNGFLETTSGSIMNVRGTIQGGLVTTSGAINIEDNAVINGPISGGTGKITIKGNVTTKSINCNCEVDKDNNNTSTANGDVTANITNSSGFERFTINGNLRGVSDLKLDDDSAVTGCMQSLSGDIDIDNDASAGRICCGGDTSCNKSCSNDSSPPLCTYTSTPYLNYRMDEASWSGSANEVIDSSGNGLHGSAAKKTSSAFPSTASSAPAITGSTGTCGYGVFDGGQYINIPSGFTNLSNSLTITAWIKTSNNSTVQRIFADDENNKGGYGLTLGDAGAGTLRFYKRSPNANQTNINTTIQTGNVINNNQWYFVAVTINAVGQAAKLFVYNPSNGSTTTTSSTLTSYLGLSDSGSAALGSENIGSSETAGFIGNIDELNVYNRALTDAEITTARQQMRACSGVLVAKYALDESLWNGTANETKDTAGYTGSPFDGQSTGTPKSTAANTAPAISGTVGTCGYATFSGATNGGSAFTLDNLPVSTAASAKTSVSFWVYWNGATDGRIAIGWGEYVFGFLGSWVGFNTNYNDDVYGVSSTGLANGWHHIVAVFNNGNVTSNKIYIDGVLASLAQRTGSANNAKAVVQSTMMVGGRTFDNLFRFTGGRIDEVKIYNGEVSQSQVTADYNATHACTGIPNLLANYHFEESTWTNASGQVIDASGNAYHAKVDKPTATARALPELGNSSTQFITSNPGTCGYAVFGNNNSTEGPIVLPASMPNLTGSFTFATWIMSLSNSTTPRRIFADDYNGSGGFIFSLNDGGQGKLRFAKRSTFGTNSVIDSQFAINANTKYFIAVSVNAVDRTATIYAYNANGTLVAPPTSGSIDYFGGGDNGNMTIGGGQSSSGNQNLQHARLDEVSIYNSALTQPQILALLQTNHACAATNVAAANFNCIVSGGSADTGRLYTQLSNTGFNIDVVALKTDRTTETDFVTSGTKNVTLEWMSGANNTCTTGTVLTPATTVTFSTTDNGRKTISIPAFNKAYRDLRCRITDANLTPNVTGCSYDNFAVRPSSFTVTSTNATAGGDFSNPSRDENASPIFKAGTDSFNLTATTNVVGYDGTPTIKAPTGYNNEDVYSWAYGASPLPADAYSSNAFYRVVGAVTGNFNANGSTGNATGNFTYSEAGYFRFQANAIIDNSFSAVDRDNGDCNLDYSNSLVGNKYGCYIGHENRTNFFGRFIPSYFTISPSTVTPACSNSFTYFGQDGLSTTFTITAKNGAGNVTQNYTNNAANEGEYYGKLSLSTPGNFYFSSTTLPIDATLSSTITNVGSWVRGTATVTAKHLISRPSAATSVTSISILTKPVDSDGVTAPSSVALTSASEFRYGKINLPNSYGSELLPLSIPIEAQYWDGTSYRRNTSDSCTVINPNNISMGPYKNNLAPCETQISGLSTMDKGKTTAKLSKPGIGNSGSVDLTVNLASVGSNNKTCTTTTESNATATGYSWFGSTNPDARASFGLFKSPIIYMRENY